MGKRTPRSSIDRSIRATLGYLESALIANEQSGFDNLPHVCRLLASVVQYQQAMIRRLEKEIRAQRDASERNVETG